MDLLVTMGLCTLLGVYAFLSGYLVGRRHEKNKVGRRSNSWQV